VSDRHLLILDLDETLIYGTEAPLDRPCDFQVEPYFIYRRPHLPEFLDTVAEWYDLAVWSSASRAYVAEVVAGIFPQPQLLSFAWASYRCTQRFHPELREYYWVKDLKKVRRAGYPLERVLVLDDSPQKLERQYGNLLRIGPFTGNPTDTELRDVLPFLAHLRTVENLRKVEKRLWREWVLSRPSSNEA
jgi:TFIIF-interacting CTD phosphatase-like protein